MRILIIVNFTTYLFAVLLLSFFHTYSINSIIKNYTYFVFMGQHNKKAAEVILPQRLLLRILCFE